MTDMTTTTKPCTREPKVPTAAVRAPVSIKTAAPSKTDTVIKLLLRAKGATPVELIAATDWQPHSVRAFLSGLRKKGRVIAREARKSGDFSYRIIAAPPSAVPDAGDIGLPAELSSNTTGDGPAVDTAGI